MSGPTGRSSQRSENRVPTQSALPKQPQTGHVAGILRDGRPADCTVARVTGRQVAHRKMLISGLAGFLVLLLLTAPAVGAWAFVAAMPLLIGAGVNLVRLWAAVAQPHGDFVRYAGRSGLFLFLALLLLMAFAMVKPADSKQQANAGVDLARADDAAIAQRVAASWASTGGPRNADGQMADGGDVLTFGGLYTVTLISTTSDTVAFTVHREGDPGINRRIWCYEPGESAAAVRLTTCGGLS